MPLNDDIFKTFKLSWGICKPYDDIIAKVDYIEQTDAGLKVHCHKVEKEKKMNKNEELKDVNCICVFKDGDEVKAVAMRDVNNVLLEGANLFTDYHGSKSKVVSSASAKCNPDDIFDFNIGAKLAMDRMYEGYDFTPRSKKLFSGKILFIKPEHEDNEFVYGCSEWEVKDGLITSLGYANSKDRNLRILRNMPCSELTKRVEDMYFPISVWSKRNKVMYLENDKT